MSHTLPTPVTAPPARRPLERRLASLAWGQGAIYGRRTAQATAALASESAPPPYDPRSPALASQGLPLITIIQRTCAVLLIKHYLRVMPSSRH